jgi:hypothetical protein
MFTYEWRYANDLTWNRSRFTTADALAAAKRASDWLIVNVENDNLIEIRVVKVES